MIKVIGATSFIGVHTVTELVNQGCEVLVTGRYGAYDAIVMNYLNNNSDNEVGFELFQNGVKDIIRRTFRR